jgi:hypothetical protein
MLRDSNLEREREVKNARKEISWRQQEGKFPKPVDFCGQVRQALS